MLEVSFYGLAFIAIMYGFMYLNSKFSCFYEKRKGYVFDDAIKGGITAVSLRRAGLYLAVAIGMVGVITGPSSGFIKDVIDITVYGSLVFTFFIFARFINDWFVLHGINNTEQIYDENNMSVGFAEFGCFVAAGIMATASMTGSGTMLSAITFFVIGQILILVTVQVYEKITKWNVLEQIKSGNISAGIHVGGLIMALSIALYGIIAKDFVSYQYLFMSLAFEGVFAVAVLLGLSFVVDRFFFPLVSIQKEISEKQNVSVAVMLAAMQMVGALGVSAAIT